MTATRSPAQDIARSRDLPLDDWQLSVEDAVDRLTGHIRHAGRGAFEHLRKAWRLHGVDDEMSAFRAITAEEEAATAVILALQRQRYPGANRLSAWNHVHKMAFWPLIATINDFLFRSGIPAPRVSLSKRGRPRVELHLNIAALAGMGVGDTWASPDAPLNFGLRAGEADNAMVHRFEQELAELADRSGAGSILRYIQAEANQRNRLLYASQDGIPHVEFHDDMLRSRANRVCVLLMLAIIVAQTPQHQIFVVQCLEAMLVALERIEGQLSKYPELSASGDRPLLTIRRKQGERGTISLTAPVDVGGIWQGGWDAARQIRATVARVTYGQTDS